MAKNKQQQIKNEKRARPLDTEAVNNVLAKGSKKQKEEKRSRRFCLTTYIDVNVVEDFIKKSAWIQHYALCTHDRDYNEDGTPKTIHTHIILYTYDGKTSTAVKKNFDRFSNEYYGRLGLEPQNTLSQDCHDVVSSYRYLRHLDDKNKAPYAENEVHTDDLCYWGKLCNTEGLSDSANNYGLQIVNDMLNGAKTRDLVLRYGKEYIYHNQSYKQMIKDIAYDDCLGVSFEGLRDMCEFALAGSNFTECDITKFLFMLEYVQNQFVNVELNDNVTKYLKA